jgi:hypothetical protein
MQRIKEVGAYAGTHREHGKHCCRKYTAQVASKEPAEQEEGIFALTESPDAPT